MTGYKTMTGDKMRRMVWPWCGTGRDNGRRYMPKFCNLRQLAADNAMEIVHIPFAPR